MVEARSIIPGHRISGKTHLETVPCAEPSAPAGHLYCPAEDAEVWQPGAHTVFGCAMELADSTAVGSVSNT